ncbi:TPA: hypothetical protein ACSP31_002875 [Aeromonas veronii]
MSTVSETLIRIETHLDNYKKNRNANDARKIGEAICRVILLNSNKPETNKLSSSTKFNVLIDSLNAKNLSEDENHLKKLK